MSEILERLSANIESRKGADASVSYTASLFNAGEEAILKKVGEEAVEVLLAAGNQDNRHLVAESADLLFHLMVLLSSRGLALDDVLNELQRREGVSGHAEKAARQDS
ncbi:MAG: phosphoribosyl-ATP diphosphatase [Gammaproteobacteria bacterium]|nr:MAG: phosphoribosyl-ATP diphosphatase [Gammaproteobacteria bacterium]PIE35554.1 MAG: phosphoribosyl-ATP diphosphatase [Gammaproteobacteria bacterium]